MTGWPEFAISLVIHGIAWCVCVPFCRYLKPRWFGLSSAIIGLCLFSGLLMIVLILPVSATYTGGPHASDLLAIWPLPFGLIGFTLVKTKPTEFLTRCACGYDLTHNVSGTCPECGRPTP